MSYSVTRGVVTPLFAATSPKADHLNGQVSDPPPESCFSEQNDLLSTPYQLLIPWARIGAIPAGVSQGCAQDSLWDWLEAQTDCFSRVTVRHSPPDMYLDVKDQDAELETATMCPLVEI